MNTHDRGWRINHGRRWRGHRPTLGEAMRAGNDAIKAVGIVAAIVIAYGIVGRIDYETERALAAEAAAADDRAALLACLNGRPSGHYFDNERGERVYLACRGVEEINVGRLKE